MYGKQKVGKLDTCTMKSPRSLILLMDSRLRYFYIMRSHALPYCFLFVKTLCCEFNLWLCVFRCYVGQSKKDTVAISCYCHSWILDRPTWILASCLVDGKVEKVLCVLNRFRQNLFEQNKICKKV